jgi:hypothetical protein
MTQPSPKAEMQAFDKLPKTLRQALRESGEQFSAAQLFKLWRQGDSCAELIDMIKAEDRAR